MTWRLMARIVRTWVPGYTHYIPGGSIIERAGCRIKSGLPVRCTQTGMTIRGLFTRPSVFMVIISWCILQCDEPNNEHS